MLHRTYEQIIVQATVDPAFGLSLLADPQRAALDAGYNPLVAASLVGLSCASLSDFALALHRRITGSTPMSSAVVAPNRVAVAKATIRPFVRTVG